jgi:hypothetical protein
MIGKRGADLPFPSRRDKDAAGRMTELDIAAVMHHVRPQRSVGRVLKTILELTFFQHDFDRPRERLHGYLKFPRQVCAMVRRLKRVPQDACVADQPISGLKCARDVKGFCCDKANRYDARNDMND